MQLETLRALKSDERIQALCQMFDEELDCLAAEIQGWTKQNEGSWLSWNGPNGSYCPCWEWNPSENHKQAHELLDIALGRLPFSACIQISKGGFTCRLTSIEFGDFTVAKSPAGTLPRAITILAIVALLEESP